MKMILATAGFAIGFAIFVAANGAKGSDTRAPAVPAAQEAEGFRVLLEKIEKVAPDQIQRRNDGVPISLILSHSMLNDQNIHLLSGVLSIHKIVLISSPKSTITLHGVEELVAMTNVLSLTMECFKALPNNYISAVSKMKQLRSIGLIGNDAPILEYQYISKMTNLEEIVILYSENYGDAQLADLRSLPLLRKVRIKSKQLSRDCVAILSDFPSLTNAELANINWHTNWVRRP